MRARNYAKQARANGDVQSYVDAMGLYADTLLLKSELDKSREMLDLALDSTGLPQAESVGLQARKAVLAVLDEQTNATEALQTARDWAIRVEAAVWVALTTALLVREGAMQAAALQSALDTLREKREIDALVRVALIAVDGFVAHGEHELAAVEALRSLSHGRRARDRDLTRNAKLVVQGLMGRRSDKGVDDLVRVALDLGHETRLDRVLERIADSTLELTGADRAFVLLNQATQNDGSSGSSLGDTQGLRVVASAYRKGHSGRPSITIAEKTIREGRELVTPDVGDLETGAAESIQAMQLRMVLCIPMSDRVRVLGAIYADSQKAETQELEDMAWLLRAFAAHAVVALRHAELLGEAQLGARRAREVVHDVRNLASGMRLGLEELEELEALPDWAQQTLKDVASMNELLLGTVGALLESRTPERRAVPLDQLVQRTADLTRFEARELGVELRVDGDSAVVAGVESDLARVVANLLGNALKYSPRGGVVRLAVRTDVDGARRPGHVRPDTAVPAPPRVWLTVADEGPGIPEADLPHIFDSGRQAEGAKAGYGLGLGICKHLVESHGGAIQVANAPAATDTTRSASGAWFTVVLPLAPGASRAG
jgi:signal transduction histidine kinase